MLKIPLATVAWIIVKAREFDVKDVDTGGDEDADSGNPLGVLEDRSGDSTSTELTSWIDDLTETQKSELVALFWLGRDDLDPSDFLDLVEQARAKQGRNTARYLLGSPLLADYIEAGLERIGIDPAELESEIR